MFLDYLIYLRDIHGILIYTVLDKMFGDLALMSLETYILRLSTASLHQK